MIRKFRGYQCTLCETQYDIDQVMYTCPRDGGNLDIILDYDSIRKIRSKKLIQSEEFSLWRYISLLPVNDPSGHQTPFRAAGWTPLYAPRQLIDRLDLKYLWIKDESRNPTGSLKDRASAVVVARAREIGAEVVVTASTGNAGAALAGMAAAVGHKAVIFAPKSAPPAKIAQLLVYGATVYLVDGNYDAAFDLTIQAVDEFGWYCRNTGYNPFTAEGKKTSAFEIWEALRTGLITCQPTIKPLCIFVSVGDGNIISGIHKGFKDLRQLGLLEVMPRIHGVQSERSAAIANAYFAGTEKIIPVEATTIADSISVDLPRDGVRAVRAATQTGGAYITVSDQEILASIPELGSAGIFAEPAGAAAYAGMLKALREGIINSDDPILVLNTGNGLKDVQSAMKSVPAATIIEPTLAALQRVIK